MIRRRHTSAFVLVFALWVLAFLTMLAVSVAGGIRQKIIIAGKLDERSRMRYLLEGAAAQGKAYVFDQMQGVNFIFSPVLKASLFDNVDVFSHIALNGDVAQIVYPYADKGLTDERFGVVDEERKININSATPAHLQRLIERVLGMKADEAGRLARAIIDWRQHGENEVSGFFSDEYYSNLQFPYEKKSSPFEIPDELLLVKGMTKDIYDQLTPYITIYGDGRVNINTAPDAVLYALGLDDAVIDKFLTARRGKDGVEGTVDDMVFQKTFDVASDVNSVVLLTPLEMQAINNLNLQGVFGINSYYFSARIVARLKGSTRTREARAVISATENKIIYWREK